MALGKWQVLPAKDGKDFNKQKKAPKAQQKEFNNFYGLCSKVPNRNRLLVAFAARFARFCCLIC